MLILSIYQSDELPAATVGIRDGLPTGRHGTLRLGCLTAQARAARDAPDGELWLAPDLFALLAVPYQGIRLQARSTADGELELGPSITVLYGGQQEGRSLAKLKESAAAYYEPYSGTPGLFAIGYDESIDWERSVVRGYVLDNRPGHAGEIIPASYPIPAVVRLTWAIRPDAIRRLRQATGERCFNWMRNIGKWQFYSLLSAEPNLAPHLPETGLVRGLTDIAVMLARHQTVFIKHVFGIKGRAVVRIRQDETGFELRHMDGKTLQEEHMSDLREIWAYLQAKLPPGRWIVQQGVPLTGREGRALDFRLILVRNRAGHWTCPLALANVAPDDRLVFTNIANGAIDADPVASLQTHHGMTPGQAQRQLQAMVDLCIAAARQLQIPFHPLGILGFDVAVSAETHELFLLEANSVPGTAYDSPTEQRILRSQIEYGLSLTGF